jgi:hypothetical protein
VSVSGKARRLDRLLAIRRLAEELDRRRMELASAGVAEVERALDTQEAIAIEAGLAGRAALESGERGDWLMADAQSEVAGWNHGRLGVLLRARSAELAPAMERLVESRREHEQVKLLVEEARRLSRVEEDRRAQAAADDWFLSRRVRAVR